MQLVELVHFTPLSSLVMPPGSGLALIDQALPFQCSIRVWAIDAPLTEAPTAVQAVELVQDTPTRLLVLLIRFRLVLIVHVLPLQLSISVWAIDPVNA
jgi:hypothetical protein